MECLCIGKCALTRHTNYNVRPEAITLRRKLFVACRSLALVAVSYDGMSSIRSVTACICTRNRADTLQMVLRSLNELTVPTGLSFNAIIIDNNSNDHTPVVAKEFVKQKPTRFAYFREDTLGLSTARNRGLLETRSDIIAFLDDDAVPRSGWLEAIVDGYSQGDDVAVVGGQIVLAFRDDSLPPWFDASLHGCYSERIVPTPGIIECHSVSDYPYGANISYRRDIAAMLGGFNPELGRRGKRLLSYEESHLCERIHRAGYRVLLHPKSIVDHYVGKERISLRYLRRQAWAEGRSTLWVDSSHPTVRTRSVLPRLARRSVRVFGKALLQPEDSSGIVRNAYGLMADLSVIYHRWVTRQRAEMAWHLRRRLQRTSP